MGEHFWLIQRGSFRSLDSAKKFLGSSYEHLIDPDYMGSAEFEWGAIPKAYRRIMGQYDQYRLHVTDLVTTGGVPFCLYCEDRRYEQILSEIKLYLNEHYRLKEWSNMEVHFENSFPFGKDYRKYQMKTNFWWCIDKAYCNDDTGDWIAFIGAKDRQNAFKRVIESDFKNWWMEKPEEEQRKEYQDSF